MNRCTVKRVIQNNPGFKVNAINVLGKESGLLYEGQGDPNAKTMILGKDCSLEETIKNMTALLNPLESKLKSLPGGITSLTCGLFI